MKNEVKCQIAFFDAKPYDIEFFNTANIPYRFEIKYLNSRLNLDTCSLAKGCEVICIFINDRVTAPLIEQLVKQGVRLIALRSTGYNHVDLKAAFQKITVVRVPSYSPYSVAEFAVGMMLSLNRKIHLAHARIQANNFNIDGLLGFDMHGKTAGVIGVGNIGQTVIKILKGFGMKVQAFDIIPEQVKQADCIFADLNTLYSTSDILTLHCPLTPDNMHMIDKNAMVKMKDGMMIINTARGGLINTADLIQGLESGKIGAAGLDVFEDEENYIYRDLSEQQIVDTQLTRLRTFSNVLMTSHQGFFTQEALREIAATTLANVAAFLEGKPLDNKISYSLDVV